MAGSTASPFEVLDFSGGTTDHVFEQSSNKAAILDNFLINHDRKPYTRFGSQVDDLVNPEIPPGERIGAIVNYANSDKLFWQTRRSIFYRNPDLFTELFGPTGNTAFSLGDLTNVASFAQWNRHIYITNDVYSKPVKIFKDENGLYQLRSQGLPALASSPTVTAGASGTQSFTYAFHYQVDYTVFDLQYETVGAITEVELLNSSDPSTNANQITNIPVITNGTDDNFDTSNITVQIFRTANGGTFFQKVGEVTNGTTTFTDSMSDNTLQNTGTQLYTNDGTVDFDPVPLHKYNHVVNNTGYFLDIKDSSGESPYTLRQSVPGVPDNAPVDFTTIVDDEARGLSSVRNMPIVLCKKYIYRVEGFFDQFGRGGSQAIRISDTAGCISNSSCVQAENGLFWFGNDGIYYTDGYLVQKISNDSSDSYKLMLQNTKQTTRIQGRFFEKERLVIWTIQQDAANQENDSFLILDLKWGVSDSSTFTSWSGKSFRPSAIEIFNNQIYRGDFRGFTLVHDPKLSVDPKIDEYVSPSNWNSETIIWKIKTIHYNFGNTFFRKIPTRIMLSAQGNNNTTIQINAINDDGKALRKCKPIRVRNNFVWRDDDFIWRVSTFVWRGAGMINQWRRFPSNPIRLSYLQLEITNGFSDITNSDTLGNATFNNTANTITLDTSGRKWPLQAVDYYIYSEVDSYTKGYLITQRNSDSVITVQDPSNNLPNSSKKWVIRGQKKGESLYLLGFNIHWMNVSRTQTPYSSTPAATGENAS